MIFSNIFSISVDFLFVNIQASAALRQRRGAPLPLPSGILAAVEEAEPLGGLCLAECLQECAGEGRHGATARRIRKSVHAAAR